MPKTPHLRKRIGKPLPHVDLYKQIHVLEYLNAGQQTRILELERENKNKKSDLDYMDEVTKHLLEKIEILEKELQHYQEECQHPNTTTFPSNLLKS